MILTDDNYLFLCHPRTASTAIANQLKGIKVADTHTLYSDAPEAVLVRQPVTFSVIRNPLDVMASWFCLNPNWQDPSDFIRHYSHSDLQHEGLLFYHYENSDIVYLYERLDVLENDFNITLKRENVTENKIPYGQLFNKADQNYIIAKYRLDYERWSEHGFKSTTPQR